jgi:serine/threonine-protein kinase
LFEDQSLTWRWQSHTDVSSEFADILNRMLANRPGDRFQSAIEILAALEELPPPVASPAASGLRLMPKSDAQTMMFTTSQTKTSPPDQSPQPGGKIRFNLNPMVQQQQRHSLAFYLGVLALIAAGLAGLSVWLIQRQPRAVTPAPTPLPLPVLVSPLVLPTPTSPVSYDRPLALVAGNPVVVTGTLQRNETLNYKIVATAGQQLQVQLQENVGVDVRLFDPDRIPLPRFEPQQLWNATLRRGGLYVLQIQSLPSQKLNRYQLTVSLVDPFLPISPLTTNPSSTPSPSFVNPAAPSNLVSFETGRFREFRGQAVVGKPQRFVITAKPGQMLTAVVVNGFVTMNLRGPNGRLLANGNRVLDWQGRVRRSGNYEIEVIPQADTAYELKLGLR